MKKTVFVPRRPSVNSAEEADYVLAVELSRRKFIGIATFIGMSAFTGTTLTACSTERELQDHAYFTNTEFDFINAAISRLIPSDEVGAGAREADVATFIDQQLAGGYGRADRWYMLAPFHDGTKQQGYQLSLTPAELYRQSIAGIEEWCQQKWSKTFVALSTDQQDQLLHLLEDGKIKLSSGDAKNFFDMLWQNTQEGFLADPIYGGNKNFAGWALIGFPGPRYNYLDDIDKWGQPYAMPYVSIGGERAARQPEKTRT